MNIGIDLGGSHIAVGFVDNGKIITKREMDFEERDKKDIENIVIKKITEYISEILEENALTIKDLEKIGIASPGTTKAGVIVKAKNLGLYNFNIVDRLKLYYKEVTIKLENDAKCAAMCEKEYGSLKKYDDSIFVCLGTGVRWSSIFKSEKC